MSYFSWNTASNSKKCAVIGCTAVGGAISNAILQSELADKLVLIDPNQRLADGLAADLYAALPLHADTDIWAGDYTDLADCALIVLALGSSPLNENAHADLAALNAPLIHRAATHIAAYGKEAVVLVVSYPYELMTYIALKYAGLPWERVIGIGTLPLSLLLRRMLSKYLGIDARYVDCTVLGQADPNAAICQDLVRVGTLPLSDYLQASGRNSDPYLLQSLYCDALYATKRAEVANGCAQYTLSNACVQIADAVLNDKNTPMSLCISTQTIPEFPHACLSLPCLLGKKGVRPIPPLTLSSTEMDQLQRCAAHLHAHQLECEQVLAQK